MPKGLYYIGFSPLKVKIGRFSIGFLLEIIFIVPGLLKLPRLEIHFLP